MIFNVYAVYDPEVESFNTNLTISPLEPKDHGEQCRRAFIKMEQKDKAFMLGKKVICLGQFDDETGKIEQSKLLEVFHFVEEPKEDSQVEEEIEGHKNV